jgi:hypothetical protein
MAVVGPYDDTIPLLADIPRPRPLRMSFKGGLTALLTFPGPLVLLAIFANDARHQPTPGITIARLVVFFGLLEVLLVGLLWLRPCLKHRRLVSEGDLAIGLVTEADHGNGWVRYAFDTPSGERLTKLGQTYRGDLFPGMKVPVFYDPQKPKNEIGLVASFYEVQVPQDNSRPAMEALVIAVSIVAILSPLLLLLRHLGRADLRHPAILVALTLALAIHVAGRMRRHWWFWATMAVVGAAHVLLILRMHWNENVWVPAQTLTGLALVDLLVIFVLLRLVVRLVGGKAGVKEYFPDQKQTSS